MKIALLCNKRKTFYKVYDKNLLDRIEAYGELSPVISAKQLNDNADFLAQCEVIFSTWGMPVLTETEVKQFFPNLKAVFYAAGTVQYFAQPFLKNGVRIFSAAQANALPVADFTFAQILLAAKGYFQSLKFYRPLLPLSYFRGRCNHGNYKLTVGLVGLGAVGAQVAKRLQATDAKVLAYDAYVTQQQAAEIGVELVSIEQLMKTSDVISNHLPDKAELKKFFNYRLLKTMKNNATFINTGRGHQVSEWSLARALLSRPARTAVIDVLKCEIFPFVSPLWWCANAVLTPHIAGSTGKECRRMAEFIFSAFSDYAQDKKIECEITLDKLKFLA